MKKMPKTAKKAADYIRETVKRPKRMPKEDLFGKLRWRGKCPLGLLKETADGTPGNLSEFKTRPDELTNKNIKAFYGWWDGLSVEDTAEAMDAIWGKE